VDETTEWFIGENWNCTISPAAAWGSLGVNVREPFAPPTRTTCILIVAELELEELAAPVASATAAEDETDFPRAPTTLKAVRAKVVNCILIDS